MKPTGLLFFIFFWLLIPFLCHSSVTLTDSVNEIPFTRYPYKYLEDTTGHLSLEDILTGKVTLQPCSTLYPATLCGKYNYWIELTLTDGCASEALWLLELFNNRLDHVDYYYQKNDKWMTISTGDLIPFQNKYLKHKNFCFPIVFNNKKNTTIYLKISSSDKTDMFGMIRKVDRLVNYSLSEYIGLGIFYGFMISILFFTLILIIYLRIFSIIYYFIYVLSFIVYTSSLDGIGFQYVWPNMPGINAFITGIALSCFIISELLFVKQFLQLKQNAPLINQIINFLVPARIIYFLISVFVYTSLLSFMLIDVIPILILFVAALIVYRKGKHNGLFVISGVSFFLIGFTITMLMNLNLITHNLFTVYAMNIGIISEILIFSVGIAFNIYFIKKEKEKIEHNIHWHKKELMLRENQQSLLEQKVRDRTDKIRQQKELIERKNKELDTFLYKSSHNLRGPLKTIEGLYLLANKENDPDQIKQYLHLINESIRKMDEDLLQLRAVTELNKKDVVFTNISVNQLLSNLESRLKLPFQVFYSIEPVTITSDQFSIENIFFNLLTATAKIIGGADEKINVNFTFSHVNNSAINNYCFQFLITGVNINPILMASPFKPFNIDLKSVFNINFEYYISKLLTERLGGEIYIEYNSGNYTLIYRLIIPVNND